jgi:hypothetical protein
MTDDELMNRIAIFESSHGSDLLTRIRTRRPYVVAFNKVLSSGKDAKATRQRIRSIFDAWKAENKFLKSEFILNFPPKFGTEDSEWLDILVESDHVLKSLKGKNENLTSHFNRQNLMRRNTIRIFAKNDDILEIHEKELSDLYKALN